MADTGTAGALRGIRRGPVTRDLGVLWWALALVATIAGPFAAPSSAGPGEEHVPALVDGLDLPSVAHPAFGPTKTPGPARIGHEWPSAPRSAFIRMDYVTVVRSFRGSDVPLGARLLGQLAHPANAPPRV